MPRTRKPKLVPIKIKRKDGIIQRIRIRGKKKALAHPLRVDRKGSYIYSDEYAGNVARAPERRPAPTSATTPAQTAPTEPTTPAQTNVQPPRRRPGAKYSTWFKAHGSIKEGAPKDHYQEGLMDEPNEDFAAPTVWFSNQGALLGQVKWKGIISLDHLIDQLNAKLQYYGEATPDFDFRTYYTTWSYRYQVIETLGPSDEVIEDVQDAA